MDSNSILSFTESNPKWLSERSELNEENSSLESNASRNAESVSSAFVRMGDGTWLDLEFSHRLKWTSLCRCSIAFWVSEDVDGKRTWTKFSVLYLVLFDSLLKRLMGFMLYFIKSLHKLILHSFWGSSWSSIGQSPSYSYFYSDIYYMWQLLLILAQLFYYFVILLYSQP